MGHTLDHGRLLEVLAGAHFAHGAGLFELALEFLEGSFDVFAFFDGNDDHALYTSFFSFGAAKLKIFGECAKFFLTFVNNKYVIISRVPGMTQE